MFTRKRLEIVVTILAIILLVAIPWSVSSGQLLNPIAHPFLYMVSLVVNGVVQVALVSYWGWRWFRRIRVHREMEAQEILNGPGWFSLSVVYVVLSVLSVAPIIMLPMAFDAPGSEKNGALQVLVASIAFFPISCLLGAILPWIFRRWRNASKLFLIPVLNVGVSVLLALVGLR